MCNSVCDVKDKAEWDQERRDRDQKIKKYSLLKDEVEAWFDGEKENKNTRAGGPQGHHLLPRLLGPRRCGGQPCRRKHTLARHTLACRTLH